MEEGSGKKWKKDGKIRKKDSEKIRRSGPWGRYGIRIWEDIERRTGKTSRTPDTNKDSGEDTEEGSWGRQEGFLEKTRRKDLWRNTRNKESEKIRKKDLEKTRKNDLGEDMKKDLEEETERSHGRRDPGEHTNKDSGEDVKKDPGEHTNKDPEKDTKKDSKHLNKDLKTRKKDPYLLRKTDHGKTRRRIPGHE
ncbi:splicing regulatory glutamine/lysine-rich protein 1-like [Homarus americanus]|uniref:splicing regulatory glutamine/lysine-rich protein 1-like n=1 Tax=Homarus americanus TaxID=6706 RepID=UPI001C4800EF|nr:splicing regulatory glutamine/lysine-rich protein 1-like [Homarus americanus]